MIDTETTRAQNVETQLAGDVVVERTRAVAVELVLNQKIDDREIILDGKITTEQNRALVAEAALGYRVDTEEGVRLLADQALGIRIDTEIAARQADVSSEQQARVQADSLAEVDYIARIATETSARQAAISTEQIVRIQLGVDLASDYNSKISAETLARQTAITAAQNELANLDSVVSASIF